MHGMRGCHSTRSRDHSVLAHVRSHQTFACTQAAENTRTQAVGGLHTAGERFDTAVAWNTQPDTKDVAQGMVPARAVQSKSTATHDELTAHCLYLQAVNKLLTPCLGSLDII